MNPETRALILALLENHDPADVHSMMRRNISTEPVSYTEIRSLRRGMLRSGAPRKAIGIAKKPRPSRPKPVPQPKPYLLRALPPSVDPSEQLRLATEAMFERKAKLLNTTVEAARQAVLCPSSLGAQRYAEALAYCARAA